MLLAMTACAAVLLGQTEIPLEENAPPEFPRTVRRGDQICYQTIDNQGQMQSNCHAANATGAPASPNAPVTRPSEAGAAFVAAVGALGGADFATGGLVAPQIQLYGEAGARIVSNISIVGVLNASLGILNGGTLTIVTLAPGVRIGQRMSATVSLGVSFVTLSGGGSSIGGTAGNLSVTGVFPVAGPFSILGQVGATFDGSGAIFNAGAGVGASF